MNRENEIQLLTKNSYHGLLVVYGRRRIGKTRLLNKWLTQHGGVYAQAIVAASDIQIRQLYADIKDHFKLSIEPKSWTELLELLVLSRVSTTLCIDEFPYLVASDPALPSILQNWLDQKNKEQINLVLSGSSQRMMYDTFLDKNAPLYGRAFKILHIQPMSYAHFCKALELDNTAKESFLYYSLVGGVPRYWEYINKELSVVEMADELYFNYAAFLENEPELLLIDEKIEGIMPINILEAIGRGSTKPSEIASRIGTSQTNLSRVFQLLKDMSIIQREIPFGESERDSKKSLYKIVDPVMRFWYSTYSPHRSRWNRHSTAEKEGLIALHASTVFEDCFRFSFPMARRYWESNLEFDGVESTDNNTICIYEVKFKTLAKDEKADILKQLQEKHQKSKLSKFKATYKVVCLDDLAELTSA